MEPQLHRRRSSPTPSSFFLFSQPTPNTYSACEVSLLWIYRFRGQSREKIPATSWSYGQFKSLEIHPLSQFRNLPWKSTNKSWKNIIGGKWCCKFQRNRFWTSSCSPQRLEFAHTWSICCWRRNRSGLWLTLGWSTTAGWEFNSLLLLEYDCACNSNVLTEFNQIKPSLYGSNSYFYFIECRDK